MTLRSRRTYEIERIEGGARVSREDELAVEEPLEIRIAGDPFAVTMRTPGHDRELVLGLLFAEGLIAGVGDVGKIAHCGRTGAEGRENTIDVVAAPGKVIVMPDDSPARRGTITSAACGVCGRQSIEDLMARCSPVESNGTVTIEAISRAVAGLRETQPVFARTGGTHCAVLSTFDGAHVAAFEDIGRHNAVDKLIGSMLKAGKLPLSRHVLVVSGRTSFEIVQKAVVAGVPVVASVSAPSSLAVELARKTNLTLAGFVRDGSLNLYAGGERVVG